jgi:hypothetical protein
VQWPSACNQAVVDLSYSLDMDGHCFDSIAPACKMNVLQHRGALVAIAYPFEGASI